MAGKKKSSGKEEILPVAVVVAKKELVLEGDPDQQLEFAQKAAKTLMKWVEQKPKKVVINGEQFLEFGDWQIIARFYGATVGVEWTKGIDKGWEARAVVYRNGEILASAEAMCTRDEKNWKNRDEFMIKSMAQTRASAKALRQAFGWVAELAGMKSTPAEEMDGVGGYDASKVPADVIPTVTYDADEEYESMGKATAKPSNTNAAPWRNPPKDIPLTVDEQRKKIYALLEGRGVNVKDGKACKVYVADETQLELVETNFGAIIKALEQ